MCVCDSRRQNKGLQDNYRETLIWSQAVGRQGTISGFLLPSTLKVEGTLLPTCVGEGAGQRLRGERTLRVGDRVCWSSGKVWGHGRTGFRRECVGGVMGGGEARVCIGEGVEVGGVGVLQKVRGVVGVARSLGEQGSEVRGRMLG